MKSLNTDNLPVVVSKDSDYYLFPEITHVKKGALLTALAIIGTVQGASRSLKWNDDRIHYHWLHTDPVYAAAVDRARQIAASNIEDKLYELGVEGYDKPVLYEGQIVLRLEATVKDHPEVIM